MAGREKIVVELSSEKKEQLRAVCEKNGWSMRFLVLNAVEDFLASLSPKRKASR